MKKIRVMIVEDSAVVRALLEYSIGRDPRLEVCATTASAEEALEVCEQVSPDVIAMDIRLPGIDGLEATRRIMSNRPIPIVVVAASVESKQWNVTAMEALRAGALTVIEKPVGTSNADYEELARTFMHATGHHEPGEAGPAAWQRRAIFHRRTEAAAVDRQSGRVPGAGNCMFDRRPGRV